MKILRFRLTCIGIYFYHRRYTLSLSWRGRWTNRPGFLRDTVNGGWTLVCGPLILEKDVWPEDDDWGVETMEIRLGILESLGIPKRLLNDSTHEAAEAEEDSDGH